MGTKSPDLHAGVIAIDFNRGMRTAIVGSSPKPSQLETRGSRIAMTTIRKTTGVVLAAAAASLFLATAAVPSSARAEEVKCQGINACKGQSACKSAANSCKGLNACKGQGWLPTATEYDCLTKGGTVIQG
jgi:hypothetical protein